MPRARLKARTRLKHLAHYILEQHWAKQQPVTLLKIQMLCYLIDMEHYREHFRPLTGATYLAQAEGPRPIGWRYVVRSIARRVGRRYE